MRWRSIRRIRVVLYQAALVALLRGQQDSAISWIERAVAERLSARAISRAIPSSALRELALLQECRRIEELTEKEETMSKVPSSSLPGHCLSSSLARRLQSATDATNPSRGTGPGSDCSRASGPARSPMADGLRPGRSPSGIVVHPDVHRVAGTCFRHDRTKPPTLHWMTRGGGGDLQITMKRTAASRTRAATSKGHCSAKAISGLGAGTAAGTVLKTCRYTVTLDGKILDPEAVIVSCCN